LILLVLPFSFEQTMKAFLGLIAAFLAVTIAAQATVQVRDFLIIHGKGIYTDDTPSLKHAFPKLIIPAFGMISTANYKGYSATWAVFEGQLYLVGLEARIRESGEMLWDEKVLQGQKFPIKVEEWSGVVRQSSSGSSFDPNTGIREQYDRVTTITFENGKVTQAEFDRKVPRGGADEGASK
jgi:hypothetical protein